MKAVNEELETQRGLAAAAAGEAEVWKKKAAELTDMSDQAYEILNAQVST